MYLLNELEREYIRKKLDQFQDTLQWVRVGNDFRRIKVDQPECYRDAKWYVEFGTHRDDDPQKMYHELGRFFVEDMKLLNIEWRSRIRMGGIVKNRNV